MARASKVATKSKKNTVRATRRITGYGLMPTDDWNKAKFFVHYEIEKKDWLTKVKAFVRNNFDKKTVANVSKLPDWKLTKSHWACIAHCKEVAPDLIPVAYNGRLEAYIQELSLEGAALVEEKKVDKVVKTEAHVPTIQERITEQSQYACEAIEEWIDSFIANKKTFDPKGFDFVAHFASTRVTQAHARKIKLFYANELEEAQLIQKLPTPGEINRVKNPHNKDMLAQLREGYSHFTKKDAATYLTALETIVGACDVVIDTSKATRKTRVKKPVAKEKLIAKLKFLPKDDKLQLVSVNPLEVIDAQEVWIYNVKTRKLGKYVAEEGVSIQVKGTSLTFFDERKSVQKTLRKPAETLKEFKKASKVKLRKFMEEIKTTDIKLNGRLNADTIILKVY